MLSSPILRFQSLRRYAGATLTLGCALALTSAPMLQGQTLTTKPLFWPDRQGPTFNSIIPEADAAKLPLEWDEASGKGIVWKTPIEGEGHSSPVIGGDLVWFTAATEDGHHMYVYAINRHDGKIVHHKLLFENQAPEDLGNPLNNYAAPSPVLDDDAVYIHFGTYGTAKLNPLTAEVIWQRRDINVRHYRGPGSSPVLFENLLILTFDGIDKQFVTALNKDTGETVWLTPRSTDYGDLGPDGKPLLDGDYRKAYGTPTIMPVGDQVQLLSVGSRAAFGYDIRSGKELWTIRHAEFNASARPLVMGDTTFINTGSDRSHLVALKLTPQTSGDITEQALWDREKRNSALSSPLIMNNYIFQVTGAGVGVCVNPETGEDVWSERISPGKFIATPIATKERIYFFSDAGFGTVVAASPEYKQLAQNKFESPVTASPAVAEGALYVRTKTHLIKLQ